MKKPWIYFLVFIFIIFSLSCGQEGERAPSGGTAPATVPSTSPPPPFGNLTVQSWGVPVAKVYVDTIYQGQTPLTIENVPTGTHTIKVTTWGLKDIVQSKQVSENQETTVSAVFIDLFYSDPNLGGLIVDEASLPIDIFLDGVRLGQTPYKNMQLLPGENKLLRLQRGIEEVSYQYITTFPGFITYIQPNLKDTTPPQTLSAPNETTISYSCPSTTMGNSIQYRNITLACFDDEKKNIMKDTLDFIYLDTNTYRYPVQFSTWMPWMSAQLLEGYSPTLESIAQDPLKTNTFEAAARHPLQPGKTELYNNAFTNIFSGYYGMEAAMGLLSSLLLHEALHGLGLAHTGCSASDLTDDWQDPNAGGVYGTEARHEAKLASLGNHPWLTQCIDRKLLYIQAESRIQTSICDPAQRINLRSEFAYPACSIPTHFRDPDTNQLIIEYLYYRR